MHAAQERRRNKNRKERKGEINIYNVVVLLCLHDLTLLRCTRELNYRLRLFKMTTRVEQKVALERLRHLASLLKFEKGRKLKKERDCVLVFERLSTQ